MRLLLLLVVFGAFFTFGSRSASGGEPADADEQTFTLKPIGLVEKTEERTRIVLKKEYEPGLLGLDGFSHVHIFWWFDRNDTPQKRSVLQVHPMGNRENPLTGVFATRSPVRPNLIALSLCKIVRIEGNAIEVERIDAFDGTPVLDIKPHLPGYDSAEGARVPEWLKRARDARSDSAAQPVVEEHGEHPGLHNVLRLSDRLVSGSEPHGEEGFASVERLGVKTIVSVDGARPPVEMAKRHGLRYVHIPISYRPYSPF